MFYPFNIEANKWSRSCNGINDPYAKLRVLDIIKNLNDRLFNLMLTDFNMKKTGLYGQVCDVSN